MINKIILIAFIFSTYSSQFCDPASAHKDFLRNFKPASAKRIGMGGFGTVYSFKHKGKNYAVKEVELKLPRYVREELSKKPEEEIQAVQDLMDLLKKSEDIYSASVKAEIKQLIDAKTSKRVFWHDFFSFYYSHMIEKIKDLKNEVDVSQFVSNESQESLAPSLKYRFYGCIQINGLKFLLLSDLYANSLAEKSSKELLSSKSLDERFHFYLNLLKKVKFLHDRQIVHCDLKLDNILFTDKSKKDFVIIDYGLATHGKLCTGGTKGFQGPEQIVDLLFLNNEPINSFKADVFALGSIIATIEGRAFNSDLTFYQELRDLQNEGKVNFHTDDVEELIEFFFNEITENFLESHQAFLKDNEDIKFLIKLFEEIFIATLQNMMKANYNERFDLSHSYERIWYLYQLALIIKHFDGSFADKMKALDEFHTDFVEKKVDLFSLPLAIFESDAKPPKLLGPKKLQQKKII